MPRLIRRLGWHPQTIGRALVIVIAVILSMEVLSPFLPVLGHPLVLVAGSLLALAGLFGARAPR